MEEYKELLRAENISKTFGVTKACQKISLSIGRGEVHGLIGENGSGKSTFTSMLCGLHKIDGGTFFLDGKEYEAKTQIEANANGVSVIVQEMGTLNGLTVAQNIFLGNETEFVKNGVLNPKRMNGKADEILQSYGFSQIKGSVMIDNYDFESRKLVEIVKATYFHPKIVVVDETTTALSQDGREILYEQMKKVRDSGNAVIFISHDLEEVIEKTDRISVLRDGQYITTVNSPDVTADDLKTLMVGREIDKKYYRTDYDTPVSKEILLKVKNVSANQKIHDVNFEVHKGEILGIGGLSDCGIHDIGKALFGAAIEQSGDVELADGTKITGIAKAIQHKIAYTSKDRDNESVILSSSIKDNICLMSLDHLKRFGLISRKKQEKFANDYAVKMSVKMQNIDQYVSGLSGGNKQKVVLARWLGKNPDLLILDSPTRGIDIKVKADIYALMDSLRLQGKSIVMISEEIMELIGMCDRILIFNNGTVRSEFKRDKNLTEQDLIKEMI